MGRKSMAHLRRGVWPRVTDHRYEFESCPDVPPVITAAPVDCDGCSGCPDVLWHRCHKTGVMLQCLVGREEDPLGALSAKARLAQRQPRKGFLERN